MPLDSRSQSVIMPCDFIASTNCRIKATQEVISGEKCFVLQNGLHDTMWLPVGKGLCVMKREIRDFQTGELRQRTIATALGELKPGLWLPTSYNTQVFSRETGTNNLPALAVNVHILTLRTDNEVPNRMFTATEKPGAICYDNGTAFHQVSPGGEELLDKIADCVKSAEGNKIAPGVIHKPRLILVYGFLAGITGYILLTIVERCIGHA